MFGADDKVYVKFGPGKTDEMPVEWASVMLIRWRERDPVRFGKMLAEVVTDGLKPVRKTRESEQ